MYFRMALLVMVFSGSLGFAKCIDEWMDRKPAGSSERTWIYANIAAEATFESCDDAELDTLLAQAIKSVEVFRFLAKTDPRQVDMAERTRVAIALIRSEKNERQLNKLSKR